MAKNQSMARVAAKCLLLAVSISSLAACRAGFDPSAVNLDGIVVNYSKNLANLSKPTAAVIFGKLSPKAGSEFVGDSFENEIKNVIKSAEQISLLSTKPGAANQQALKDWAKNLADERIAINKALINASKDAQSSLDLAKALEPLIKDGGFLSTQKNLVAPSIVDSAAFTEQHKILTESMERLYQLAVLTANTLSQQKVSEASAGIRFGLEKLAAMVLKRGDLFSSIAERHTAQSALTNAIADLDAFDRSAGGMTKANKVWPELLTKYNAFQARLVAVNADVVGKVVLAAQSDALAIQTGIRQANTNLSAAITAYNAIENSKNAPAGKLADLVAEAFLGKVSTVTGAKLSEKTDINDLAEKLADKNVVFVKADDASRALVDALSSSVAGHLAQGYGLTDAINVIGPDADRLMKDRQNFVMDDGQFDAYLKNIGKKIRENGIKEGGQKNIYVVFANDFPKNANVKAMVDELSKDKGKVLVIGHEQTKFPSAQFFKPRGLSASEGLLVAHELLKKEGVTANQLLISDRIARLFAGYGDMNLNNFGEVVETVASRVKDQDKSDLEIQGEVIKALDEQGIKVTNPSAILKDSLAQVQRTVAQNKAYYQTMSGLGADTSGDVKAAEIEKLRVKVKEQDAQVEALRYLKEADSAVREVEVAVNAKKALAEQAMINLAGALDKRVLDINQAFKNIYAVMDNCTLNDIQPNSQQSSVFSNETRELLLSLNVLSPFHALEVQLMNGTPDIVNSRAQVTKASCLIFGNAKADNIKTILQKENESINNKIKKLKQDILNVCIKEDSFVSMQSCFIDKITVYEDFRKSLASPEDGSNSLLQKVNAEVISYPDLNQGLFSRESWDPQNFWLNPSEDGALYQSSNDKKTFGWLINSNKNSDESFMRGFQELNQLYYVKSLLNIIGDNNRKLSINAEVTDFTFSTSQPYFPSDPKRGLFLKYALKNFQTSDALMVKARLEINKQYEFVVAAKMAKIVNDLVQGLFKDLITPFWSKPADELAQFFNDVGDKKVVWDEMAQLSKGIKSLALDLKENFESSADGNTKIGDYSAYYALMVQLNTFRSNLEELSENFVKVGMTAENTALMTGYMEGSPLQFKISSEIKAIFESAFDLARYNTINFNGKLPSGEIPRSYINVDPTDATKPGEDSWHSKAAAGGVIKHPLEP